MPGAVRRERARAQCARPRYRFCKYSPAEDHRKDYTPAVKRVSLCSLIRHGAANKVTLAERWAFCWKRRNSTSECFCHLQLYFLRLSCESLPLDPRSNERSLPFARTREKKGLGWNKKITLCKMFQVSTVVSMVLTVLVADMSCWHCYRSHKCTMAHVILGNECNSRCN